MYKFKEDNMKVPAFIWSGEGTIEEGALQQLKNASSLPFAFHHTVLCPDGHIGYGAPIGGILATENVIIPNFVGKDIGCGLCTVKTSLTNIDTETLKKIMGGIRKMVPLGFKHHKQSQEVRLMPGVLNLEDDKDKATKGDFDATESHDIDKYPIIGQEFNNALKQIGTLGGGNHFIEIQKGSDGHIWIMIHSGSRNIGLKTADYYNNLAIKLNNKWHSEIPEKWELAFLPMDSEEGQNYLNEMNYCVDFALAKR